MHQDQIAGEWYDAGALETFADEEASAVTVANETIAVFRLADEVFALHDECTHGAARLSEGFVLDGCVECPLHQGLFDIRTGKPMCPPVEQAVRTYPVRIHDGRIQIQVRHD